MFYAEIKLNLKFRSPFGHGISTFNLGNDYIDLWKSNALGLTSTDKDGNSFVAVPPEMETMFFSDYGGISYFYLQQQITDEAFQGMGLSLSFAFVVLVLSTMNWIIALMATFTIFCIVVCVIGFVVMMGFKLGVVEAVLFVMIVGLSVDYVVHLSTAYLESGFVFRKERAQRMLGIAGISIISGAVSTMGGIVFLCGAYIVYLFKFGTTILFLSFSSILFSLIGFTAAVSLVGPQKANGDVRWTLFSIRAWWTKNPKHQEAAEKRAAYLSK